MLLVLQQNNLLGAPATVATVPNVVGLSQAQGTTNLQAVLFVVAVSTAYSSTVPAGTIISQSPAAGTDQVQGSIVTITVSLGDTPSDSSGGWAFFFRYEQEQHRRRKRRQQLDDADDAVEKIAEPVDREIAQLLHKQVKADELKADVERLRGLVAQFADSKAEAAFTDRAKKALARVRERNSLASILKLDKELRRQLEDEEMTILMLLIND